MVVGHMAEGTYTVERHMVVGYVGMVGFASTTEGHLVVGHRAEGAYTVEVHMVLGHIQIQIQIQNVYYLWAQN